MPFQTHPDVNPNQLENMKYGFFTNEKGSSAGGYVVNGQDTRNVNLNSPQDPNADGYDPAKSIIGNLMACFSELTHGQENAPRTHKFIMTSNYAVGGARILECKDAEGLDRLKSLAESEKSKLALPQEVQEELQKNTIHVLKADAMVFKGIPSELVAVGGASGDAHPIILFDDKNKVCAYIAGAHAALSEDVVEKTIFAMRAAGAQLENIQVLIGPGLGKKSYELGLVKARGREDIPAPEYLKVPEEILVKVRDEKHPNKWLVDIEKLITCKLSRVMQVENLERHIHNMDLDTMGFDLYDQNGIRKTNVNFTELSKNGPLFFSARRGVMEKQGLETHNPGLYNTVGRHFAGFTLRG